MCGVQQLESLLSLPAQLTLMPSNSFHPGQAVCNQHFNSLVCGNVHATLFQNNRPWKLGTWDNAIPEGGILPRKEHRLGRKSLSLKGTGLHSGQTEHHAWTSACSALLADPHLHSPPLLLSVPVTGCASEDVSGT